MRHDRYDLGAEMMVEVGRPALLAIASHRARQLGLAVRLWCGALGAMHRQQHGLQLLRRAVLVLRHNRLARALRTWAAAREFQARRLLP